MALQHPDSLFDILDQYDSVKGIIWGHIHQSFDEQRNGIQLMGTPSTCIQFVPKQDEFGIDLSPPGYRWLELHPDGSIRTGVEHIPLLSKNLDVGSSGY